MKIAKVLIVAALAAALAVPAFAQNTLVCSFEDGTSTILGSFGNLSAAVNVMRPDHVYSQTHALRLTESPHSSTPQAYVAYIEGLTDGDVVDASFWGWDDTPAASPSLRIWGHYAVSGDVNSYNGSAGGNSTYTDGTGWSNVGWSWTFDSSGGTRDALVVEVRLYSTPSTCDTCSTDYWVDGVVVTAPETATITLPCYEPTPTRESTWGAIKGRYQD
jgi:hypothetical protein